MTRPANKEFELKGINHLALVCRDMKKTVKFYRDVLGMPLIKTIDLPRNLGQHFFFDIGNGDALAFFWFPDAPAAAAGVSAPEALPTQGSFVSGHGSMNHVAFNIDADKFDDYHQRLIDKGITVSRKLNHDDSPMGSSEEMYDGVYVRSMYFFDPDGICLEFAAWTREFTADDVQHEPKTAADAHPVKDPTGYAVPAQ